MKMNKINIWFTVLINLLLFVEMGFLIFLDVPLIILAVMLAAILVWLADLFLDILILKRRMEDEAMG